MTGISHEATATYYGRLAYVALHFYIETGNVAELDAAYWYARYAARSIDNPEALWK
jgi:hypothetical protein